MFAFLVASREYNNLDHEAFEIQRAMLTADLSKFSMLTLEKSTVYMAITEGAVREFGLKNVQDCIMLISDFKDGNIRIVYLRAEAGDDAFSNWLASKGHREMVVADILAYQPRELVEFLKRKQIVERRNTDRFFPQDSRILISDATRVASEILEFYDDKAKSASAVAMYASSIPELCLAFEVMKKELTEAKLTADMILDENKSITDNASSLELELASVSQENTELQSACNKLNSKHYILQERLDALTSALVGKVNIQNLATMHITPLEVPENMLVLYFKEINHVDHLKTFISTLAQKCIDNDIVVKTWIVESDSFAYANEKYRDYEFVTLGSNEVTIMKNNIVTSGFKIPVWDVLVANRALLDLVIIVDRTHCDKVLLEGSKVVPCMSKFPDDNYFAYFEEAVISNSGTSMEITDGISDGVFGYTKHFMNSTAMIAMLELINNQITEGEDYGIDASGPEKQIEF